MKPLTLLASTLLAFAPSAFAGSSEFEIKSVEVQFISSPTYQTDLPAKLVKPAKWMAVEVTFDAKPEFTPELNFNYYIHLNNRLFAGHITHVAIAKGRGLHSVAYMAPKDMNQILGGKPMNGAELDNVAVTITAPGGSEEVSAKSWKPSVGKWWTPMKQEEGHVLTKSETPFAPLYWDYYEAVKSSASR